ASWLTGTPGLRGIVGTSVTVTARDPGGEIHDYVVVRSGGLARSLARLGLPISGYAEYLGVLTSVVVVGYVLMALLIFGRNSGGWLGLVVSLALITLAVRFPGSLYMLVWS